MQKIIPLIPAVLAKALEGSHPVASEAKQKKAWALFEESIDATSLAKARSLLEQALELDPSSLQIIRQYIAALVFPPEAELGLLRKLLELAEKQLGKKLFDEAKGHFWMVYETRPYMMIRDEVANKLLQAGQLEEACAEWQAMLELNPNDNQGVRYNLLCGLMVMGSLKDADKLFQKYDESNYHTVFAWCKVLYLFITGDEAQATKALVIARKQNPNSEKFVLGKGKLSTRPLDSYIGGDISEAQMYGVQLELAWSRYPKALGWLLVQDKTPKAKAAVKTAKKKA